MKQRFCFLLACACLLAGCGGPGAASSAASASSRAAVSDPAVSAPAARDADPAAVSDPAPQAAELEFTGTVLALTGSTALVAVDEGCDLHQTSDQVTFKTTGLEDIGAQEGDRVAVGCGAFIRETYPAQVDASTWQKLAPETVTARYDATGDSMSVTLPEGWAFEEIPGTPKEDGGEGMEATYTIAFWPEADPECRAELIVAPGPVGICGTGVDFEERDFAAAGKGTVCTEHIEDSTWILVIFDSEGGRYTLWWSPTDEQLERYGGDFWLIADTITVGNEV